MFKLFVQRQWPSFVLAASLTPLSLQAEPMPEQKFDMQLMEKFAEAKKKGLDITREFDIFVKGLQSKYSSKPNLLAMINMKKALVDGNMNKSKEHLNKIPQADADFELALQSFIEAVKEREDAAALAYAGEILSKPPMWDKVPAMPKTPALYAEALLAQLKKLKADRAQRAAAEELEKKLNEKGISSDSESSDETLYKDIRDAVGPAVEIYFGEKKGQIDTKALEALIQKVKQLELRQGGEEGYSYYFLKGFCHIMGAYAILGKEDEALKRLEQKEVFFTPWDEELKKRANKERNPDLISASPMADFRYAHAVIYRSLAKRAMAKGDKAKAQAYLVSKTWDSAGVNYFLLLKTYPRSEAAQLALFEYNAMRKEYVAAGGEKPPKDVPMDPITIFKAYYQRAAIAAEADKPALFLESLQYVPAALAADAKKTAATAEILRLAAASAFYGADYAKADDYYKTMKDGFALPDNAKPTAKNYPKELATWLYSVYNAKVKDAEEQLKKKPDPALEEKLKLYSAKKTFYYGEMAGSDPKARWALMYSALVQPFFDTAKAGDKAATQAAGKALLQELNQYLKDFPAATEKTSVTFYIAMVNKLIQDYEAAEKAWLAYIDLEPAVDASGKLRRVNAYFELAYVRLKLNKIEEADGLEATEKSYRELVSKLNLDDYSPEQTAGIESWNASLELWRVDRLAKPIPAMRTRVRELNLTIKNNAGAAGVEAYEVQLKEATASFKKLTEEVIAGYEKWLQAHPKDSAAASTLSKLGRHYRDIEDNIKAQAAFQRVEAEFPGSPLIAQNRVTQIQALIDMGRKVDAAKMVLEMDLTKADDKLPAYIFSQFIMEDKPTRTEMTEAEFKLVTDAFLKANTRILEMNKDDAKALIAHTFYQGRAYFLLGDMDKSNECFNQVLKLDEKTGFGPLIDLLRVDILIANKSFQEAWNNTMKIEESMKQLNPGRMGISPDIIRLKIKRGEIAYLSSEKTMVKPGAFECFSADQALTSTANTEGLSKEQIRNLKERALFFRIMCMALGGGKEKDLDDLRTRFRKEYATSPFRKNVENLPAPL